MFGRSTYEYDVRSRSSGKESATATLRPCSGEAGDVPSYGMVAFSGSNLLPSVVNPCDFDLALDPGTIDAA